ncbi:MAG: hypothetical protein Fur0032_16770 [Terrimicrobiaceae bacterium]
MRFEHFEVETGPDGQPVELGRGAMGITYLATDQNLHRKVALKVIAPGLLESPSTKDRFLREARSAAALRHPNVATVLHFGEQDGRVFYAMEYVDGESAEARIRRLGKIPAEDALEIGIQVCRALAAASHAGIVHRDIKPSNIMLTSDEEERLLVKVIDFGLAKPSTADAHDATLTMGGFVGTPHFASPEQLAEQPLDTRSDIYSLGVTLWYLLSGSTPFSGTVAQVMSGHLSAPLPLDSLRELPQPLLSALEQFLAKDPDSRPRTADAARELLTACRLSLSSSGSSLPPGTPASIPRKPTVARIFILTAAIGTVLLALLVWRFWQPDSRVTTQLSPTSTPPPPPTPIPTPPPDPVALLAKEIEASSVPSARARLLASALTAHPNDTRLMRLAEDLARSLAENPPDNWEPFLENLAPLAGSIDSASIEPIAQRLLKSHPQSAAALLEMAISRGSSPARTRLAAALLNPESGLPPDAARAVSLLRESAQANDPRAMEILGSLTNRGIPGVLPEDPVEAFSLYTKSRKLGSLDAIGYMGAMILEGRGTGLPPNPDEALRHFREGAELGNPFCMFLLAQCLDQGTGTSRDPELARLFFAAAARGGLKQAILWCETNHVDPYSTLHPPPIREEQPGSSPPPTATPSCSS